MPTYHSPPQTPLLGPSSSSSFSHFPSRSHSFSYPSSHSRSSTSPSRRSKLSTKLGLTQDQEAAVKKKTPYVFLGSIAAASLLAHKYWPKGFPHGDKEDWELSEHALRAKQKRLAEKAEKAARRLERAVKGDRHRSGSRDRIGGGEEGYRRGRGEAWGEGRREAGGCCYREEREECAAYRDSGRGWESGRERRDSRGRSRSRDGVCGRGRNIEPSYRRGPSRERTEFLTTSERYYPPAPKRYLLEQGAGSSSSTSSGSRYFLDSSASTAGSRASGSSRWRSYEEDRPGEVVYVYRDPPPRSRRVSFDAGAVRRREGEWYS